MHNIDIKIFVNQLGNLKIKWNVPIKLIQNIEKLNIQLPSFKYDLPRLAGIPVAFSTVALPLIIEDLVVCCNKTELIYKIEDNFQGNFDLIIEKLNGLKMKEGTLDISYTVKHIVNNDSVFYVFVYPLINPFDEKITFKIDVQARFAVKIRRYKFREWYFNKINGTKVKMKKVFSKKKVGNLITVSTDRLVLPPNVELDIHLTGTRFPIMIRRDIFWFIIFFISLTIILSPIWSTFL